STAPSSPASTTPGAGSTAEGTAQTNCGHERAAKEKELQMAELTIKPEEIRAALDSFVDSYQPAEAVSEEVGRVTVAGDGIARVEGLPGVMANELVRFEDGTMGVALNLDIREIGVVILGEF